MKTNIILYKNFDEFLKIENGLFYKVNDNNCMQEISKQEFKKEFVQYFKYGINFLNEKNKKLYNKILKELNN